MKGVILGILVGVVFWLWAFHMEDRHKLDAICAKVEAECSSGGGW